MNNFKNNKYFSLHTMIIIAMKNPVVSDICTTSVLLTHAVPSAVPRNTNNMVPINSDAIHLNSMILSVKSLKPIIVLAPETKYSIL